MQWALEGGRVLRRVLRRGSKKGLSRRQLEGGNTHCQEYDPVGVRPTSGFLVNLFLTKLVRISGFFSLFSATAVFLYPPTNALKNTAIAEKREENPEKSSLIL